MSKAVQRQPISICAERIGEDDVGSRCGHALVDGRDLRRMVNVPPLATCAAGQSEIEQVGAHRTVREEPLAFDQQGFEWMHRLAFVVRF